VRLGGVEKIEYERRNQWGKVRLGGVRVKERREIGDDRKLWMREK
jgi:hypothetical protein